jgi:hypothetical protein
MRKLLLIFFLIIPFIVMAQRPKLDIRIFGGLNTTTFVYRVEDVEPDVLAGLQLGLGFRISKKRAFAELDIAYELYGIEFQFDEGIDPEIIEPLTVIMNSLAVPITIGYIPVKSPVFKWYLYGGLVNRFSLRGRFIFEGETYKFKPQELNLHTYNLAARFGTQVDVAMFNFDFNYTIGITNALKGKTRTNMHALQLSIGYLF